MKIDIYRGPSRVDGSPVWGVVTTRTDNRKIGDSMHQLWCLPGDIHPADAWRTGRDASVCGECPLRGDAATGRKRTCYVGMRPLMAIWRTRTDTEPNDGRRWLCAGIRLGAYGDPAALPVEVVRKLTRQYARHVGYTRQWEGMTARERRPWQGLVMASCFTVEEAARAQRQGWRTYRVGRTIERGEVLCPWSNDHRVKCDRCLLCSGGDKGPNIYIRPHGAGAKSLPCD